MALSIIIKNWHIEKKEQNITPFRFLREKQSGQKDKKNEEEYNEEAIKHKTHDKNVRLICRKKVIYDKQQNVYGWGVALEMYIYQDVKGWFEYDGLSWKNI